MREYTTSLVLIASLGLVGCLGTESGAAAKAGGADTPAVVPGSAAGMAAGRDSAAGSAAASAPATTAGGAKAATPGEAAGRRGALDASRPSPPTGPVRALYVNRFKAATPSQMRRLIGIADSTEINALVLDLKDEFGLNYMPSNPEFAKNAGTEVKMKNVKAVVDSLHAHGIIAIARLVVFKDSVTARVHPEWTIKRQDGSIWRDHKGLAWVNPYNRGLWDYNIGVAEELVGLGFDEIQFDYIRFPEPYKSLPQQVFPNSNGQSKPDAIAEFLKVAKQRLNALGARSTADIFGLVTTVNGPLEVAQHWERVAPVTDVLLPMVYPSHYPRGSFGIDRPNADPYNVILKAISRARERNEALGITGEHVRPYLQAFSLKGMLPKYGPAELEAQKKAVYDSGFDGWVLWDPGSGYTEYLPALERGEAVSRKK